MTLMKNTDPEILENRSGGGLISLFGLPFLAGGLLVWAAALGFIPSKGSPPPLAMGIPFGLIFVCVGGGLVFGRGGLIINRREGTVTQWWGLLVKISGKQYPIANFDRVTLSSEKRQNKNNHYTVYPVRISGPEVKIDLGEPQNDFAARGLAEQAAKFLNLPLHDSSQGETAVREAGTLDESLRERSARTGETTSLPEPPTELKSVVVTEGDQIAVTLPPTGVSGMLIMLIGSLVMPAFVFFVFLRPLLTDNHTPAGGKLIFTLFISTFFIALPIGGALLKLLRQLRGFCTVTASPRELSLTERGLLFSRTRAIPADKLEELLLANTPSVSGLGAPRTRILARSDELELSITGGVSPEEFAYIHALLTTVMTV